MEWGWRALRRLFLRQMGPRQRLKAHTSCWPLGLARHSVRQTDTLASDWSASALTILHLNCHQTLQACYLLLSTSFY